MCGLIFHLRTNPPSEPNQTSRLDTLIQARGPDSFHTINKTLKSNNGSNLHLTFSASVLALRGTSVVSQPMTDEATGCLLMWNGEAWKLRGQVIKENDTQVAFRALLEAVAGVSDAGTRTLAFRDVLANVTGPFAFLFYDALSQRILYGRDPVGRRSLMRNRTLNGDVCIASVSDAATTATAELEWEEVQTGGIYELDLSHAGIDMAPRESFIAWGTSTENPLPRVNRSTDIPTDYTLPSSVNVSELYSRLKDSIELRTTSTARSIVSNGDHDHFAVLFSGGVDCTLLAFLLDQILPAACSIDLLNVAFENPRVIAAAQKENSKKKADTTISLSPYNACPDRKTGLSSHAELCRLCPERKWRFIAINVSYDETLAEKATVAALMYPHNTEMDLSISLALYFASRGKGEYDEAGQTRSCSTQAKVLFSGLGADEMFGGYTRHAKAFAYSGLEGLFNELDLDFGRLAQRNLGRDDRVISHWGREIRYPYLDESLTAWALGLPIWEKCGFAGASEVKSTSLEPGKLLLRLVAKSVGLINASAEKKRAIQFGARTAKMSIGRTKGTDAMVS